MANIFISYSRADRQFIEQFVPLIRRVYGNNSLWYDDDIHGGTDWWQMILDEIEDCQLFVYLVSNESLESPYCQSELREALRLNKQILPVIVRRLSPSYPGNIDSELAEFLRKIQYVDMSVGFRDATIIASLYAAINKLAETTQQATQVIVSNTPTPEPPVPDKKSSNSTIQAAYIAGVFAIIVAVIAGLFGLWQGVFANPNSSTDQTTEVTYVNTGSPTQIQETEIDPHNGRATDVAQVYETLTALAPTDTPTITPTPSATATSTPLSASDIQGTAQAQTFATETYSAQTQSVVQTEQFATVVTATSPTFQGFFEIPLENGILWTEDNLGLPYGEIYTREFLGIPFEIGRGISTYGCSDGTTNIIELSTQISHPSIVYVLLQAGNAYNTYRDTEIGIVTITFSNGDTISESLILGENIRDWKVNSSVGVTTVTSDNIQQVHSYEDGRIDMLTIPLESEHNDLVLQRVEIVDMSETAPCIHITAVTVQSVPHQPGAVLTPTSSYQCLGEVALTQGINVREQPSVTAAQVGQVAVGWRLEVYEYELLNVGESFQGWYRIIARRPEQVIAGWVATDFVVTAGCPPSFNP